MYNEKTLNPVQTRLPGFLLYAVTQNSLWHQSEGLLSTFAFIERALERSPKHTDLADEILNTADRAKQAYQLLADVNRDISSLAQEFPKPVK